jgi:hypothetical protein
VDSEKLKRYVRVHIPSRSLSSRNIIKTFNFFTLYTIPHLIERLKISVSLKKWQA